MKTALPLFLTVVFLCSCGKPNRIIGSWEVVEIASSNCVITVDRNELRYKPQLFIFKRNGEYEHNIWGDFIFKGKYELMNDEILIHLDEDPENTYNLKFNFADDTLLIRGKDECYKTIQYKK